MLHIWRPVIRKLQISQKVFRPILKQIGDLRCLTMSAEMENSASDEDSCAKEGKAEVFLPKAVFYNPVQEFNRDLTIAIITQYANDHFAKLKEKEEKESKKSTKVASDLENGNNDKEQSCELNGNVGDNGSSKEVNIQSGIPYEDGITIFEGLSASGLRSVRFGLEIPGVKSVIANDYDETAVSYINKNISHNKLDGLVKANCGDAAMVMYGHRKNHLRFHVIDLDPYGSPAGFLDSAVQAVKDGGLLCVTCTDTAVLCGNAGETCWAKYGAMSLRSKFCHEMALRIILQSIESHANRYSCYITPLVSLSIDFYVRVFVRVNHGQAKVKRSASKMANVYQCAGCGSFALQKIGQAIPTKGNNFKYTPGMGPPVSERCRHCGHTHHMGGPIWADPIHDTDFIKKVLAVVNKDTAKFNTSARIVGMLSLALEELPDQPLYYINDYLASVLHCSTPRLLEIRSAILNAGYRVSLSHAAKSSIKTDAPNEVLWDILRCWVKEHPVNPSHLKDGTPVKAILSKEPSITASFTIREDANPDSRKIGLVRWQMNPQADWGPKARAKPTDTDDQADKRARLQGKKRKRDEIKVSEEPAALKQFACKRFMRNECEHGDECKYSHDATVIEAARKKLQK